MIARIGPIPLLVGGDSALIPSTVVEGVDWLISGQTNGMVERFNGRIVAEVLAITVYSHAQLEQLLRGFNAAYNARLSGFDPENTVLGRLRCNRGKIRAPPPVRRVGPSL
jgi:hypothetical protein